MRRGCDSSGAVRVALALAFLLSGAAALPTAARAGDSAAREALVGVWVRVDGGADEAARAEAIERATAGLPVPIRSVARAVMRRSVHPAERYEIRTAEPGLWIRADERAPVTARLDGALDHDPAAEVRSRALVDGFEQAWRADASTQGRTRWRLIGEPPALVVTTRVEDARFSAPLVYTTRYERLEPGDVRTDEPSATR